MSRSPRNRQYKHKPLTVNKCRKEPSIHIIKDYNKRLRILRDYFCWEAAFAYGRFVTKSSVSLYNNAVLYAKLSEIDGLIFPAYKAIIACYSEYKNKYLKIMENFNSVSVQEILSGINEIISARYKESKAMTVYDEVVIEKDNIINEYVALFLQDAEIYAKKQFADMVAWAEGIGAEIENDLNEEILNTVYKDIIKKITDNYGIQLYESYIFHLNHAVKALNYEDNRGQFTTYRKLLNEEFEILHSILTIQVNELEKYKEDSEEVCSIMNLIRETYQVVKHNMKKIEEGYKTAESIQMPECSFDDYLNIIKSDFQPVSENFDIHSIINDFNSADRNFRHSLFEYGKEVFQKYMFLYFNDNYKYHILKQSEKTIRLTKEILAEFKSVINDIHHFDALADMSQSQDMQIIQGINDTLVIKCESLEDNLGLYIKTTEPVKELSLSINQVVDDDFINGFCEILYHNFIHAIDEILQIDKTNIMKIRRLIKNCAYDHVISGLKQYEKEVELSFQPLIKYDFDFKKDSLLFEVSTFEEIMNYSVPKLRQSKDEILVEYVKSIEKIYYNIIKILESYKIYAIEPEKHSVFNAKEHEVLIAEKTEGFNKGEIVKVLAKGYRQGETVIIRANIQAAR